MKTFIALLVAAVTLPFGANAAADRSSGTLDVNTAISTGYRVGPCPPGTPSTAEDCVMFSGTSGFVEGTGIYAGASGELQTASTVEAPRCGTGGCAGTANDTWTGNVSVPGLAFDLTAPVLQGARSMSVKAPTKGKSVRVRYSVTAQDDTGGSMAVKCLPRSGSLFRVSRTKVTCGAEDTSANVATASFTVRVKRARR
jgi:HYR domain